MKNLLFLFVFGFLTSKNLSTAKTVTKRQSCGGGGCGSQPQAPVPCSGGSCLSPVPIQTPCPGGDCGSLPLVPIQTPCSGGSCGTSCSSGGCPYQLPYQIPYQRLYQPPAIPNPCPGGRCDTTSCGAIGCNIPAPAPVRTCSSCISGCSNRCSSNQCINNCLGSCSCDNERIIETATNRCCDVLHPKNCYTDDTGSSRCVVRRHRECSDLCSSSVVSIQQRQGGTAGCHYIRNYPYVYCGNYERQNCGQCFNCDGQYNPSGCLRRSECTQGCRDALPIIGGGLNG